MPVVSINLEERAYRIYKQWRDHGRSASKKVSQAIRYFTREEEEIPALQPGDKRTSVTGDELEWSGDGWKVIE